MNKGAKYYKSDFQVHSPRDLQFVGQAYVTDNERKNYSKSFIKACREKHIDAVDKDEIKTHVKEIMEGGTKAFELRKVKYGF